MTRAELLANLREIHDGLINVWGGGQILARWQATIDEAIRVIETECAPRGSFNDVQGINPDA